MIIDIEHLKKIDEIISCEGSILSIFKYKNNLYLSSILSDRSGVIYYATKSEFVINYLKSEITLVDLYKLSTDIFVTREYQKASHISLSSDFDNVLQFGDFKFNQINSNFINHRFVEMILNNFLS